MHSDLRWKSFHWSHFIWFIIQMCERFLYFAQAQMNIWCSRTCISFPRARSALHGSDSCVHTVNWSNCSLSVNLIITLFTWLSFQKTCCGGHVNMLAYIIYWHPKFYPTQFLKQSCTVSVVKIRIWISFWRENVGSVYQYIPIDSLFQSFFSVTFSIKSSL